MVRADRERALQLLSDVGLADRAEHLPGRLSGGEQQRVAIARALANAPRVVLADEPTGNLDATTAQEVVDLLVRLNEDKHVTVVVVTHDADVASRMRRRVRLKSGEVVSDTTDGSVPSAAPLEPTPHALLEEPDGADRPGDEQQTDERPAPVGP
jgi:predicted ABC-type transport system involved in lysophospholipase L1 biosynthesis ATPase subunit